MREDARLRVDGVAVVLRKGPDAFLQLVAQLVFGRLFVQTEGRDDLRERPHLEIFVNFGTARRRNATSHASCKQKSDGPATSF